MHQQQGATLQQQDTTEIGETYIMSFVVEDVVSSEDIHYPSEQSLLLVDVLQSLSQQQLQYEHKLTDINVEDIGQSKQFTNKLCHLLFGVFPLTNLLNFGELLLINQPMHILRIYLEAHEHSRVNLLMVGFEEIEVFPYEHCIHCLLISLNMLELFTDLGEELEGFGWVCLLVGAMGGSRVESTCLQLIGQTNWKDGILDHGQLTEEELLQSGQLIVGGFQTGSLIHTGGQHGIEWNKLVHKQYQCEQVLSINIDSFLRTWSSLLSTRTQSASTYPDQNSTAQEFMGRRGAGITYIAIGSRMCGMRSIIELMERMRLPRNELEFMMVAWSISVQVMWLSLYTPLRMNQTILSRMVRLQENRMIMICRSLSLQYLSPINVLSSNDSVGVLMVVRLFLCSALIFLTILTPQNIVTPQSTLSNTKNIMNAIQQVQSQVADNTLENTTTTRMTINRVNTPNIMWLVLGQEGEYFLMSASSQLLVLVALVYTITNVQQKRKQVQIQMRKVARQNSQPSSKSWRKVMVRVAIELTARGTRSNLSLPQSLQVFMVEQRVKKKTRMSVLKNNHYLSVSLRVPDTVASLAVLPEEACHR